MHVPYAPRCNTPHWRAGKDSPHPSQTFSNCLPPLSVRHVVNTRQGSPDFETHHPDTKGEISKSTSIVGILRNAERETTVIDAWKVLGSCFKMWETG